MTSACRLPNAARPTWFPNWNGETAALVGAGESATSEALSALRGRCRVLVINTSYKLAPWADALYACDPQWWNAYKGAPDFPGLKITQDAGAARKFDLRQVRLVDQASAEANMIVIDRPGMIGRGGHGGFQALNLLVQFGVRRVLALLDCRGDHWHGDHPGTLKNPKPQTLAKWAEILDGSAPQLRNFGIEFIDVTRNGALTVYPKMSIDAALR